MHASDAGARRPTTGDGIAVQSGLPVSIAEIPRVTTAAFRQTCLDVGASGGRLVALSVLPGGLLEEDATPMLLAALANDAAGRLVFVRTPVPAVRAYPALTPAWPQAQAFERQIFEEHRIVPEGHPWLKPLRRPPGAAGAPALAADHSFFQVEGSGIHEVAVGPVHAGIIEPGHFRFQCNGETVLHLEIQLGYQHRGAAAWLLQASPARRLAIVESLAGDTVIGHATAHCQALETLSEVEPPLGAHALRGIALEIERLANHVGDLGALCGDIGYLPGAAWFGRLRGEFLNLLLELSGNRFGRSLIRPGGVRFELPATLRRGLLVRLAAAEGDLARSADLVFASESVTSRFENTGVVRRDTAEALGLVGPAARASGCDRDVRRDHPGGIYRFAHIPLASVDSGDVLARALVRWLEAQRSLTFVREQLEEFRHPVLFGSLRPCRPRAVAVSLVEGWRGEIAHVVTTGAGGELAGYDVVDPSFHNWFGLAMAVRGNQISDFPLCNKSFNLSYAGHDL